MIVWGFLWLCFVKMGNIFWGMSSLLCLFWELVIGKMVDLENYSFDLKGYCGEVCKVKISGFINDGVIVNRVFYCK